MVNPPQDEEQKNDWDTYEGPRNAVSVSAQHSSANCLGRRGGVVKACTCSPRPGNHHRISRKGDTAGERG